jgi:Fe-coproporphyrin III synthase
MITRKIIAGFKHPLLILPYAKKKVMQVAYNLQEKDLPPTTIGVAVNNICNARCKTCDFGVGNKDSSVYKIMKSHDLNLDLELFKKLVNDVKSFKPEINFNLVEPLLHPKIDELVKIAKSAGLRARITSNGFLLKDKAIALSKSGLDDIQISIDGPPNLNNEIRGLKDGFSRAIEGARILKENSPKTVIRFNFTISNLNYDKIVDTLEVFKQYDFIDGVQIEHLSFVTKKISDIHNKNYGDLCHSAPSSVSDEVDPKKMGVDVLYNQLKEVRKRKYHFKVNFVPNINFTLENLKTYYFDETKFVDGCDKCPLLYTSCYLSTDGDIRIHTRCYNVVMGNIKEKSFLSVWNCKKYRSIRKSFYKKTPPACSRCCGVLFNI